MRHRTQLLLLLALRLFLSCAYSALIPLGEAPDEADHFAYAAFIAREGTLPAGPEITQGKHPPLYHLMAAAAMRVVGAPPDGSFLRANPDIGFGPDAAAPNFFVHTRLEQLPWRGGPLAFAAGRWVTVLMGLLLVAATHGLGRALWPHRRGVAVAAAAFVAFLPESLFMGGVMSNDIPAAAWATLALWAALGRTRLRAAGAGLFLGLAILTKASTGSLAVVVALALAAVAWRAGRRMQWARAAVQVAIAGIAATAVSGAWFLRNLRVHGDLMGWPLVLATIDRRTAPLNIADLLGLAKGWWPSFFGKFGGAGHLPLPAVFYWLWAAILAAAVAGWILWLRRRLEFRGLIAETSTAGWIVLFGAPLVTIAGIISYSMTALGTDQGRLLFPVLGVIGLWIASGLRALGGARAAPASTWLLGAGFYAVGVIALLAGIVTPFAPPPAPDANTVAAARPVNRTFGGELELAASERSDTQDSSFVLYWRAARIVDDDLRTVLRVVDEQDDLIWEWKRSPGAGRFSTDRWPAGREVADPYRIPSDMMGRGARIELGVRAFPEGPLLPLDGGGTLLILDVLK